MRAIAANGYHIVYLTSRPLVLACSTRRYLERLDLPMSPVVTSPYSARVSLLRELNRSSHFFKAHALKGIQDTFQPSDDDVGVSVFHSGFGNRDTDVKAYAAAGIAPHRSFVIDVRGRVTCAAAALAAEGSYPAMLQAVNEMFPPLTT
jgi:phosphatidate phosphatase LPIN